MLNALENIEQNLYKLSKKQEVNLVANPALIRIVLDEEFKYNELAGLIKTKDMLKSTKGCTEISYLIEIQEIIAILLIAECKRIEDLISSYQSEVSP